MATKPKLSVADKLDAHGIDAICAMIANGKTQREIADDVGVAVSSLSDWLRGDETRREQSARAMLHSAEAWLDRGLDVLGSALERGNGIDASAARAYAQECARRAAVRNPAYRDKSDVQLNATVRSVTQMTDDELAAIASAGSR